MKQRIVAQSRKRVIASVDQMRVGLFPGNIIGDRARYQPPFERGATAWMKAWPGTAA
jgi:hypothetical protein